MTGLEGLGKGRCTQQFLPDKHPGELGGLRNSYGRTFALAIEGRLSGKERKRRDGEEIAQGVRQYRGNDRACAQIHIRHENAKKGGIQKHEYYGESTNTKQTKTSQCI